MTLPTLETTAAVLSPRDAVLARYDALLELCDTRGEAVRAFDRFLRGQTAWLDSPASTRFHLCRPGGLLEHSVNVAETLLKLRDALAPDLPVESCVIAALFHDLGKAGMPGRPFYLPNPDRWWVEKRGVHYVVNQDLVHLDIPTRSLFLLAQHLPLTDDEAQAVRYHDGQYVDENHNVAHRETRLTRLLQCADNWAGGVLEGEP